MKQIEREVNKYISEDSKYLNKCIKKAVDSNEKIHMISMVGSGKTTFAVNLIEKYINMGYKIIMLFPQISISEQVEHIIKALKIENKNRDVGYEQKYFTAKIFNRKYKVQDVKYNEIILSTIDSAYKLLEDNELLNEKTIIIVDETHTLLQGARKNFHRSITAILDSNFPVIGLSATPSVWVNSHLIDFDTIINVRLKKFVKKTIIPIKVENSLIRTVANILVNSNNKKHIVFLQTKKSQRKMKKIILKLNPKLKVLILNSDTKKASAKKAWNMLMKNGMLLDQYDIIIANSVVQAGINILNNDIDQIFIVGQYDPFGFAQFLGRARHYKGDFKYYYNNSGRNKIPSVKIDFIERNIDGVNYIINADNVIMGIAPLMGETVTYNKNGKFEANKNMIANKLYSPLGEMKGGDLCKVLDNMFPSFLTFKEEETIEGVKHNTSEYRRIKNNDLRPKLADTIISNIDILTKFMHYIKPNSSHNEALEIANGLNLSFLEHIKFEMSELDKTKNRKTIRKIINMAKNANISVDRVKVAITLYNKSEENKEEELISWILKSERSIVKMNKAIEYFKLSENNPTLTEIADNVLENHMDKCFQVRDWLEIIRSESNLPDIVNINKSLYMNAFIFKVTEKSDGGKRVKCKKLIGVNKTLEDYINNNS